MLKISKHVKNFTSINPKPIHLGHYLGAIKPTLISPNPIISISDLEHLPFQNFEINKPKNQGKHAQNFQLHSASDDSLEACKNLLACFDFLFGGTKSYDELVVYKQSDIMAILELSWFLTTNLKIEDLNSLKKYQANQLNSNEVGILRRHSEVTQV